MIEKILCFLEWHKWNFGQNDKQEKLDEKFDEKKHWYRRCVRKDCGVEEDREY